MTRELLSMLMVMGCLTAQTPWPATHTTLLILGYRPEDVLPQAERRNVSTSSIYVPTLDMNGRIDGRGAHPIR